MGIHLPRTFSDSLPYHEAEKTYSSRRQRIAHFVLGVDGNLILQIAGRVLFGSFGNLAQRSVHKELEGKQDHERQGENNT